VEHDVGSLDYETLDDGMEEGRETVFVDHLGEVGLVLNLVLVRHPLLQVPPMHLLPKEGLARARIRRKRSWSAPS